MSDSSSNPPVDKLPPPQEEDVSHIPYVIPQQTPVATPTCGGLPTISTLPPIATARPLSQQQHPQQTQYAHHTGNIPVVNGVRQAHSYPQPQYAPTVVNLSAAPSAAAPHLLPEMRQPPPPPFFEYMDKCRYAAGFMLCYYVCTFLFLQPFFLGVLGIITGFLGYYGSRPPIFAAHVKWIRGYLWMNMSLLIMNVWYAAIMLFFLSTSFNHGSGNDSDDGANLGGGDSPSYYERGEQQLGIFIGVIIGVNLVLHTRGVRTARCFYAEMLRAGPLPGQRTVVVLGNPA